LLLFAVRRPVPPKGPVVGVTEVGAIAGGLIPVPSAQLAIPGVQRPSGSRFLAVVLQVRGLLAALGLPVSLLGAQVTLLRPFDEDLDAGIGLDGVHLAQDGFLVALPLVGFLVAAIGSTVPLVGLPVPPVGLPVPPVCLPVAPVGFPVPPVLRQVPFSAGIAPVGSIGALRRSPIALLGGSLSLRRSLAAKFGTIPASLGHLPTLLGRQGTVDPVLVGLGALQSLRPLHGDPFPLLGDVAALVGHPVPFVGDAVTLIGHAVPLVGTALALVRLGGHRASLP